MDSATKEKKEKVGPDGLSKKERRALKVQAKQQEAPSGKANIPDVKSEPVIKGNEVKTELSEKEKRKLEWEKKLAEQKEKSGKDTEGLSKAELKAKRREQQEAQRQAKAAALTDAKPAGKPEPKAKPELQPKKPETKSPIKKDIKKPSSNLNKVSLVQHLYVDSSLEYDEILVNHKNVHPAFIQLGTQYRKKTIIGSNARTLALLFAMSKLVEDLETPTKQEYCRYLEGILQNCTNYLQYCRPFAVSMTNTLRHFKLKLTQIDTSLSDNDKKAELLEYIGDYINDDIQKAGEAISIKVQEKISNGDVILTFGCSSLIKRILVDAHVNGKHFKVIVVDGRPLLEGREMCRRLMDAGINCTYILVNTVSYVMNSVNKVLLGAHALLTNGYVMSRIGTAQIALVAQAFNKPVLVCCEAYKFCERVQTDSFVYNEIDDPNKLCFVDTLEDSTPLLSWKDNNKLTPLNLLYDVTPPDFVTAVVTELAILPCTSVPVVLRVTAN